jgi:hypothetical protein
MTARPWKPEQQLDGALARGALSFAVTLAAEALGTSLQRA